VASGVIHHDPYDPHAADGLVGMKATIRRQRDVFPDLHITIDDQVAEDDRVATRWTAAMTHQGSLTGEPPTGRAVTFSGITIDRFEDGKIVEAWRSMDTLHLLAEIGVVTRTAS
jgi:predicted ester cyclase